MLILLSFILRNSFIDWFLLYSVASKPLKSDLQEARKHKTIRETTFAMRGNAKPFGKRLSPCAETPNHSGNDFRHARKLQTIREMTFAMCGNTKPFGKWLSPSAEMPNHSGNNFRHARKYQTIREITFAMRGNAKPFGEITFAMRGNHKPFGKWLSPCAETPNHSGNDFRHARKHQTFCGMSYGRPAKYINEKSTLKKCIFKVLCKRRRLPTLPHCIAVPSAQVGLTSLFGMGRGGPPPQ